LIRATEIKKGFVIEFKDALWEVLDTQPTRTGKGGGYVQVKMRHLEDGHVETHRLSSSETVEKAFLQTRRLQYLYNDGSDYVFMDPATGEQYTVEEDRIRDALPYLAYNVEVEINFYQGRAVSVELPPSVVLEVTQTEPAVRGDTVSSVTKPAQLETGLTVKVPAQDCNARLAWGISPPPKGAVPRLRGQCAQCIGSGTNHHVDHQAWLVGDGFRCGPMNAGTQSYTPWARGAGGCPWDLWHRSPYCPLL